MIICPNCNHQNPEGSVQCESCYTPLPSTSPCPNCGASVQTDATFCGQCGFNLQGSEINVSQAANDLFEDNSHGDSLEEDLILTNMGADTFQSPWDLEEEEELTAIEEPSLSFNEAEITQPSGASFEETEKLEDIEELEELSVSIEETDDLESWISSIKEESSQEENVDLESEIPEIPELSVPELETPELANISELENPELAVPELENPELANISELENPELAGPELENPELADVSELETSDGPSLGSFMPETSFIEEEEEEEETTAQFAFSANSPENSTPTNVMAAESPANMDTATRLQLQQAVLFHTQTGTNIELPLNLAVVHIGKPNNQVPPDIDVSGFPNSEIVSRTHADIRVEGDTYFIEDRGSSNGTYINHSPLLTGNRHRLRKGDRISLGKGDLMTFIFQIN